MLTVVLAVVLPALGCLAAGLAAGRAWGRAGAEDAEARAYERGSNEGWHDGYNQALGPLTGIPGADDGPLVPLPDRLPDADTLTRMYAELGDHQDPSGPAGQMTLSPFVSARGAADASTGPEVTAWDSDAPAERVPTIAELADDAEYRLCWAELGAMRDSARAWYADTFSTGTLPAVR